MRKLLASLLAFAGLLAAAFIVRYVILGGATRSVVLEQGPPLGGIVSQALGGKTTAVLPQAGLDYNLTDVHYFDNKAWLVVSVSPRHNQFDPGIIVFEKLNGSYVAVLGPGSAFDSSYLLSLPNDVGEYLKSQGVIYESF